MMCNTETYIIGTLFYPGLLGGLLLQQPQMPLQFLWRMNGHFVFLDCLIASKKGQRKTSYLMIWSAKSWSSCSSLQTFLTHVEPKQRTFSYLWDWIVLKNTYTWLQWSHWEALLHRLSKRCTMYYNENIVDSEEEMFYPYCNDCSNKDKVCKRGAAKKWIFIACTCDMLCVLYYFMYIKFYVLYFCQSVSWIPFFLHSYMKSLKIIEIWIMTAHPRAKW